MRLEPSRLLKAAAPLHAIEEARELPPAAYQPQLPLENDHRPVQHICADVLLARALDLGLDRAMRAVGKHQRAEGVLVTLERHPNPLLLRLNHNRHHAHPGVRCRLRERLDGHHWALERQHSWLDRPTAHGPPPRKLMRLRHLHWVGGELVAKEGQARPIVVDLVLRLVDRNHRRLGDQGRRRVLARREERSDEERAAAVEEREACPPHHATALALEFHSGLHRKHDCEHIDLDFPLLTEVHRRQLLKLDEGVARSQRSQLGTRRLEMRLEPSRLLEAALPLHAIEEARELPPAVEDPHLALDRDHGLNRCTAADELDRRAPDVDLDAAIRRVVRHTQRAARILFACLTDHRILLLHADHPPAELDRLTPQHLRHLGDCHKIVSVLRKASDVLRAAQVVCHIHWATRHCLREPQHKQCHVADGVHAGDRGETACGR